MMGSLPAVLEEVAKRPSLIVSADGKPLYRVMNEYRRPVAYDNIPQLVIDATVAAEDKRFFEHSGIDYWGIGRAVFNAGRKGGGSTLTMQLAKRAFTSTEKSLKRKVRDMALAIMIEREKTKFQILELYLNQVYYGSGAFGIGAAADVYFGKSLDQLTVAEAALLARLVRRPSDENPFDNLDAAIRNRNIVLGVMRDEGKITAAQYEEAVAARVRLRPRSFGSGARILASPYFVHYVLDQLKKELPDIDLTTGGYRIETTINTVMDDYAQKAVRHLVDRYRRQRVTTAAFVLVDNLGRIKAMTGGYDYSRNQYNVIYQGHRQPGSSFKPIVYATALSRGVLKPTDSISNEKFVWVDPASGKPWVPKNSGGGYGGSYSVRSAIAFSKNVPAVRVCDAVGPEAVVAYAHDVFGIKTSLNPVLSIALGSCEVAPLEMAEAYSVFQNLGDRVQPYGIARVIGPDGSVIKEFEPVVRTNILDSDVCQEMDGFLRAVVTSGTGKEARSVEGARGKTGTTQENRDAWFCGYTPNLIGIGWIANEKFDERQKRWIYDPMPRVFGGTVTVELWTDIMNKAQTIFGVGIERKARRETVIEPIPPQDQGENQVPIDNVNPGGEEIPTGTTGDNAQPPVDQQIPEIRTAPKPNNPPPATEEQLIAVDICAETGDRATIYCPETVIRTFVQGKQPKSSCKKHGG